MEEEKKTEVQEDCSGHREGLTGRNNGRLVCDQNVKKPGGGRTEVRTKEEEGGGEEK